MHSAAEIIKINKITVKHSFVSHSLDKVSAKILNSCQAEMNVTVCNGKSIADFKAKRGEPCVFKNDFVAVFRPAAFFKFKASERCKVIADGAEIIFVVAGKIIRAFNKQNKTNNK